MSLSERLRDAIDFGPVKYGHGGYVEKLLALVPEVKALESLCNQLKEQNKAWEEVNASNYNLIRIAEKRAELAEGRLHEAQELAEKLIATPIDSESNAFDDAPVEVRIRYKIGIELAKVLAGGVPVGGAGAVGEEERK